MKVVKEHPVHGKIIYCESPWTGKRSITVNGVAAVPLSKKVFMLGETRLTLSGNSLTGLNLCIGMQIVELSPKPTWYEILLAVLPFIFLMVWGNSVALCEIFPVIAGGIGGSLAGALGVLSLSAMKSTKSVVAKLLVGMIMLAATIFISNAMAVALLSAIA